MVGPRSLVNAFCKRTLKFWSQLNRGAIALACCLSSIGLNFMGVERDFTHPGGGILKTVCDRSGGHT